MNVQSSKDILAALVGFDTVSRNSNLDLIAWVEGYLDRLGVKHERIYDETGKKSNLWADARAADVPGYILSATPTWFRSTTRTGPTVRSN
jgi:acetylornithine deacetylase